MKSTTKATFRLVKIPFPEIFLYRRIIAAEKFYSI
jgi:hypothetical protein